MRASYGKQKPWFHWPYILLFSLRYYLLDKLTLPIHLPHHTNFPFLSSQQPTDNNDKKSTLVV